MNMFTPQTDFAPWMPKFDPNVWQSWLKTQQIDTKPITATMKEFGATIDPSTVVQLQNDYMQQLSSLWQEMLSSKTPAIADRRFAGPEWQSNPMFAFNAATYLLNSRFLMAMANAVEATPRAKQKIRFAVQQLVDAMSPANFLATNPEVQQKLIETKGESLMKGISHMIEDLQKGHISQSDESAFEVGRNVANTEGAVVFENAFFQLIQYKPLTKTVFERPLLLVPPCINKYYILDLQPENSLVRYAVSEGHTVFLVSWRNPDASLANATWDDYIEQGAIEAINVVRDISKQEQINALGFCVGGTILSTALALLFARGEKPVSSVTLLTTLLDFSETGVIDVFIDEAQVALREKTIGNGGLMPGRDFTSAFSSLRPNDLVWNYVKSNYLKGEDPPPFDLLYWNADATNLPGPMFCWYLRNLYLENSLKVPGKLAVAGTPVDLGAIDVPAFIYGSREDHIVPWTAAYESTNLLNSKKRGNNRFVLGASGHIAGVINPPAKKKRSYWSNDKPAADAGTWLQGATEHTGSWWPEWSKFLEKNAGGQVKAPKYGSAKYKVIEPAPGRYVKVKAE
ncbi:class I poly(R)-hydroxyalkanoic acid synthase [Noviherbaspirillum autotrophicum]|uniref:Poly(R)-hydroxyalkanoic acid synthase n=1 Tax=Noviherbaspirillum autotrophicum TaxID=709839 RepID=A0A0C1YPV4_9BURK|nr:class I poly(R)-hydroxyalkanoic acid synthase [Noviherbaspirillum autotrophicum]KIF82622.1 poly(R)-hydroxyalkanoic acid synthase [Noviherbaspirillum autotrophicum]